MTARTPGTRRRVFALLAALGAIAWALPLHASAATTVVTIQFDDGTADQYTARSILSAHTMHATFYVNTGVIDDSTHAHMTWQQLTDLYGDGNEIAGHTLTHDNIKKLKYAPAHANVCQDRNNLISHGFQPTSFAYPFGSFNDRAELVVHDCGYNSGRGVSGVNDRRVFAETIPPLDAYATRTPPNPKQGTTLATIEGYVTAAEANGGWVQLVFHHVCDQCDAYSITPANLSLLLDWLQTQAGNGVVVMTTAQVIGGDVQLPVTP
jgi:peptidoglycan/xylan/chitin deacetylase (PgdA/CDA1 family)